MAGGSRITESNNSKRLEYRTLPGARFLALVLQHVLPKGFRRTRNYGFLHSNSKTPDRRAAVALRP